MAAACRSKRSSSGWSDASCRSCNFRNAAGPSSIAIPYRVTRLWPCPPDATSVIASRRRLSYAIHDSDRHQAHRDGTARQSSTGCSPPPRRKSVRSKQSGIRAQGSPVFTVDGQYTSRGWTEWTQGFQFGSAILQFDATGDSEFLEIGRDAHRRAHGAARHPHRRARPRLQQRQHLRQSAAADARRPHSGRTRGSGDFYELALKCSGAVQAARWTTIADGGGYHLLVQRPALAVRRHDPHRSALWPSATSSATC